MKENWEINWKDYYLILQVHPTAEPEVIKAAYWKLAQKYNTNSDQSKSDQKWKDLNEAYEILGDSDKKRRYDSEYSKRSNKPNSPPPPPPRKSAPPPIVKPKPIVRPKVIRFDDVLPGEIKRAIFTIDNEGGSYSKKQLSNPSSWINIVDNVTIPDAKKLPLVIKLELVGRDWGQSYIENIIVKLDNEETHIRIELHTKLDSQDKPKQQTPAESKASKPKKKTQSILLILACIIVLPIVAWQLIWGIPNNGSKSNTTTTNISISTTDLSSILTSTQASTPTSLTNLSTSSLTSSFTTSTTMLGIISPSWISYYDGPSGGNDAARAIVVDTDGYIYVTGVTGFSLLEYATGYVKGYATIKYDMNGNQVWVSIYDGGGSQGDDPSAIAVDAEGNVYVTGWSSRPDGDMGDTDYATIKYDANGNQIWVARYNAGGDSRTNISNAIVVDSSGNVYVTGQSEIAGVGQSFATIKYDSNGNELWVSRYAGPLGYGGNEANGLVTDTQGNVYVNGQVYGGSETFFDNALVKYDSNGNQLWVKIYDGPAHGEDYGGEIGLDSSGNVLMAFSSSSDNYNNNYEYAIVKYDQNGNLLWVCRYDGGNVTDMAIDASGNVYVTGYYNMSFQDNNIITIKCDNNGNLCWDIIYNGQTNSDDVARAIIVDTSGNVYVTGGSQQDCITIKYDSNGNMLWATLYNGKGNGSDTGIAIALDNSQNLYITGSSHGTTSLDLITLKYSFDVEMIN